MSFKTTSLPTLTRNQLISLHKELVLFFGLRMWFLAHCGLRHWAKAQAAIQAYRDTWDPEATHIHVRQDEGNPSSFKITGAANEALYSAGFLRFRYKSVEEDSTGRYTTSSFKIIRTWGDPVTAVFVAMTTSINGKLDSSSFFLLRRDKNGDWKMLRSWQLECPPDSNAWQLGTAPLGANNLTQWHKLGGEAALRDDLVETHKHLISGQHRDSFLFGSSRIRTGRELRRAIGPSKLGEHGNSPEEFAAHVDHLLFQTTSSPTRG